MNNQLEQLKADAERIQASIAEKEKQIEALKQSIKFDKRRLKINQEERETLSNANS